MLPDYYIGLKKLGSCTLPESKRRTDKPGNNKQAAHSAETTNPAWYKPVMFGLMLLGLVWVMVYYISQTLYPIPNIGGWNIVIGFGIAMVGFFMTTNWK